MNCYACTFRPGVMTSQVDHYERGKGDDDVTVRTETISYCNHCWARLRADAHFHLLGIVPPTPKVA